MPARYPRTAPEREPPRLELDDQGVEHARRREAEHVAARGALDGAFRLLAFLALDPDEDDRELARRAVGAQLHAEVPPAVGRVLHVDDDQVGPVVPQRRRELDARLP